MPDVRFGVLGPVVAWRGLDMVELDAGKAGRCSGCCCCTRTSGWSATRSSKAPGAGEPAAERGRPRPEVRRRRAPIARPRRRAADRGHRVPAARGARPARQRPVRTRARKLKSGGDLAAARQRLTDAMALWRGTAFSGIDTSAAATERARLDEYCFSALEDLAELDLLRGEHALAIPELSRLAAEHSLRGRDHPTASTPITWAEGRELHSPRPAHLHSR